MVELCKTVFAETEFGKTLETMGTISFGKAPFDSIGPKLRKFQEWQEITAKRYYQGDVNKNGQKDGQGILIESSRVVVSFWKADKPHGAFTIVFPDGVV